MNVANETIQSDNSLEKTNETILEVKDIFKDFSGVTVLSNVNIKFKKGKVHAIVGENGAGKTTLMKIISGFLKPTSGYIYFENKEVQLSPDIAKKLGIILIPQELNTVDTLTVYDNIFLGDEKTKSLILDKKLMIKLAKNYLKELKVDYISPTSLMGSLTPSQKQMVEITKAVHKNARVIIMDEPTAFLTEKETESLFEVINYLKSQNITVIYISHKLSEIFVISDFVTVLRDGQVITTGKMSDFSEKDIVRAMVGRSIDQVFPEKKQLLSREPVLRIENLSVKNTIVNNVSFELYKGEILGFYGLIGSGRTEVAEAIIGLRQKVEGKIFLGNKLLNIKSPLDAQKNGIVYLPEDRKTSGIIETMKVYENITLQNLGKYTHLNFFVNKSKEKSTANSYKKELNISLNSPDQIVQTLSGGNQQKIVFAKLLDVNPKIFILDEPTRGIDVGAKQQIYLLIKNIVDNGGSCIFISSELPEIVGMCNRVIVMREGEIAGIVENSKISEENIAYLAISRKVA